MSTNNISYTGEARMLIAPSHLALWINIMLGNFAYFLSDDFFSKSTLLKNSSGVQSAFGSRSGLTFKNVGPDMGPNCLQTTPAGRKLKSGSAKITYTFH